MEPQIDEPTDSSIRLLTTQSDREKAADLRARLETALAPVLAIWDEASREQFIVGFRLERDGFGRARAVVMLNKEF